MVVSTYYLSDARVRREAETLASLPEYEVTVLALKGTNAHPRSYKKDAVEVRELNADKYRGSRTLGADHQETRKDWCKQHDTAGCDDWQECPGRGRLGSGA